MMPDTFPPRPEEPRGNTYSMQSTIAETRLAWAGHIFHRKLGGGLAGGNACELDRVRVWSHASEPISLDEVTGRTLSPGDWHGDDHRRLKPADPRSVLPSLIDAGELEFR